MTKPTQEQTTAYLKKIGFTDSIIVNLETLNKIVEGHIFTFPFETISLHDSNAKSVDTSIEFNDMFDRLVNKNRGGHCVVLNLMLQTMLQSFGFNVKAIVADTLWKCKLPKSERSEHCASIVTINDDTFLVDAGFGSVGLLSPVSLKEGIYTQFSQTFKINLSEEYEFECAVLDDDKWESMYGITNKIASLETYKKINKIQSDPLNADCSFSTIFLCTKPVKEGNITRVRIFNEKLHIYKKDVTETLAIKSQTRLKNDLSEYFTIDLKDHTLRYTDNALKTFLHKPLPLKTLLHQYKKNSDAIQKHIESPTILSNEYERPRKKPI